MRRRWLVLGLASLLLLALGVAVGRRTAEPERPETRPTVTVTVPAAAEQPAHTLPPAPSAPGYARTPEGAVTAAAEYLAELGGPSILDPAAVRSTVAAIASSGSRDELARAYESAAETARERLGVSTLSNPRVLLRTVSVGYRLDGFHPAASTISVWRVGIVGSPETVEARQSWRTETVALVWEDGTWKVDAVRSVPGPTPPLAGPAVTPADELLSAIPSFEEFDRDVP